MRASTALIVGGTAATLGGVAYVGATFNEGWRPSSAPTPLREYVVEAVICGGLLAAVVGVVLLARGR